MGYHHKAYTLIELLIVVAIIGILAAIAVPNFLNAQMRARVARVQADLRSIGNAVEMYALDYNSYPSDGYRGYIIRPNGWVQLTTPTTYITASSFPDPFKVAYSGQAGDQDAGSTVALYEMGTGSTSPGGERYNEWMINSLGPDNVFGQHGGGGAVGDNTSNALQYPYTASILRYDSSNGLHSAGDIYRFRGGSPAPQVSRVDGRPWGN